LREHSDPEKKVEFIAERLPESENGKPAMNKAWQRGVVPEWEGQPLNDELKRVVEAGEHRNATYRARREPRRAARQAELRSALEEAKTAQPRDEAKIEEIETKIARLERVKEIIPS
jgi:hypothetical protein